MTDAGLTADGFLGGRITILQPKQGYRAGIDPVLLAAAVPARSGQTTLELGLGAGTASLCLAARVSGLSMTGVELLADYAALALRNAQANGADLQVFQADLRALPADVRAQSYDHVLMNPPYFRLGRSLSPDIGREAGRREGASLAEWIGVGLKRLKPGGYLIVIQAADRLSDVLAALQGASVTVRPIAPRAGRPASLVICQARKGSRAAFRLAAPLILHEGERHLRDGDDYAAWARDCLRNAAPLPAL